MKVLDVIRKQKYAIPILDFATVSLTIEKKAVNVSSFPGRLGTSGILVVPLIRIFRESKFENDFAVTIKNPRQPAKTVKNVTILTSTLKFHCGYQIQNKALTTPGARSRRKLAKGQTRLFKVVIKYVKAVVTKIQCGRIGISTE